MPWNRNSWDQMINICLRGQAYVGRVYTVDYVLYGKGVGSLFLKRTSSELSNETLYFSQVLMTSLPNCGMSALGSASMGFRPTHVPLLNLTSRSW